MEDGHRRDSKEAGTLLRDLYLRSLAGNPATVFVVLDVLKCFLELDLWEASITFANPYRLQISIRCPKR